MSLAKYQPSLWGLVNVLLSAVRLGVVPSMAGFQEDAAKFHVVV